MIELMGKYLINLVVGVAANILYSKPLPANTQQRRTALRNTNKGKKVFDVSVSEFFRSNNLEDELNLPMMKKIKMIDALAKDEQKAIFKVIDLALSNKKLKDNLQSLIAQ